MTEALLIAVLIVGIANFALVILLISGRRDTAREIDRLKRDMLDEQRALRAEVSENTRRSINAVGETLLNEYQRDTLNQEQRFKTFALENAQRMEQIRRSVERQLADIREDNGKKLDEILSLIRKIPVEKNTLRHPFLFYAQWFNPRATSGVLRACKDPVLPKDENISLFWLGQLEALADTQTNPKCALRIYEDILSFFDPKNGFDNPQKAEALKAKLQMARANATQRAKK